MPVGSRTSEKPQYISVCHCGAPLVGTFLFRGKEWICLECGNLYEFFGPDRKPYTDELAETQAALRDEFISIAKDMIVPDSRHEGCAKCKKGEDHDVHATPEERRRSDRAWSELHKRVGRG